MSQGYDDNVNQTPTNSPGIPTQVLVVPTSGGTPSRTEVGIGPDGQPTQVVVPGAAPTTRTVVIPGRPGQERIGSFVTRAHAGVDIQFASRKTLFTFDLRSGGNWYWDRPGKDVDYTGSMALIYLRRLTPRMQFTASLSTSTQTQPDLTQVNTVANIIGSFTTGNARAELSYRLTPRFSVVGNVTYNAIYYWEKSAQIQNFGDASLGLDLRYLYSPRFTLTGQLRYSSMVFPNFTAQNASTVFALVGGEVTLSRRFTGNLLFGASLRKFDESGQSATAPYAELGLDFQLAKATVMQITARYGLEAPQSPNSQLISLRGGLNIVQSFSPRLRGTLGATAVRQTTTSDGTDLEFINNTVDSTIGFEYSLSRSLTLNANYTYITQFGTNSFNNLYRNQIFFGGQYIF